jgi:hypothetical protein
MWLQWVAANAPGEVVGLGATALAGGFLPGTLGRSEALSARLATAGAMVAVGTLEGAIVALAQWLVLRRVLLALTRREWVRAAAIGAAVVWILGMIPSTLLSFGSDAEAAPFAAMSDTQTYLLAAGMGLVLGPILALPQGWVLRCHLEHAGWWIPANAVAWAVGMVVVFFGAGSVPEGEASAGLVLWISATLAVAGAAVGAIHGIVLIGLLRSLPLGTVTTRAPCTHE